ncbi:MULTISPECIES: hypothetical protein [unclassified Cupriavidus]|uniref:hypothetical protein n=1 Tax=Cupriavidus sp. H19C3 TaxID=3241603 RepID=UPI0011D79C8C|nr:MAG: hypothetical protein E6Q40_16020 [Cupriavidus sp.]
MEALTTSLARLSRHAQACAESLSAAAAAAADPQVRAVLAHRANMQRCAAGELGSRACRGAEHAGGKASASTAPASMPSSAEHRRRDPGLTPPADASELALLRHAAQQAARAAAALGAILREPLADPELRLLLAHYYRGATELQRMLEARVAESMPVRQPRAGMQRGMSAH